jgi:hypothetical protein
MLTLDGLLHVYAKSIGDALVLCGCVCGAVVCGSVVHVPYASPCVHLSVAFPLQSAAAGWSFPAAYAAFLQASSAPGCCTVNMQ